MSNKDTVSSDDTRMPLTTRDPLGQRIDKLKELIPEAFAEGEIDFERLRQALGDSVGEGRERYGLTWAGKADAIRAIQAPSAGTLVPCPEESVNFDTTENLFIEGDNLEVLKLLQKSYYGKVKMIYIDPPYNTGNEFIYPDNFKEGLEDYLKSSGQVGEGGVKLSTNTETSGRYHSKWLNMMYPRLFLARNLLRQDGVIFVSIDDHEVHNLRQLMDEIFGEENFLACITWKRRQVPDNRNINRVSTDHEYVLAYGRGMVRFRGKDKDLTKYTNPDDDPRGPWMSDNMTGLATKEQRPNLHYTIVNPETKNEYPPHPGRGWAYEKQRMESLIAEGRVLWPSNPSGRPRLKRFLNDVKDQTTGFSTLQSPGYTTDGTREVTQLLGFKAFDFPKPTKLITILLDQVVEREEGAIILDFFAGSCTTAEAVLRANANDDGNRRFVMVQLPEPLSSGGEAAASGFSTLSDIGAERIKQAIASISEQDERTLDALRTDSAVDFGFRTFKLTSSNFKVWDATDAPESQEAVANQLKLFADHVLPDRSEQDILYELMLKAGLPLTAPVEEKTVADLTVYSIAGGLLMICLADEVTQEVLRGMIELAPQRIVCLDAAFKGNDQLKTNTVLEMKSHDIEFRTV
jgi:adenine-specific DNA-methyltransferase